MAQPSRTSWPDYAPRPVMCSECGRRVTLKQAHRSLWDEQTRVGSVRHRECERFRVRVVVELANRDRCDACR